MVRELGIFGIALLMAACATAPSEQGEASPPNPFSLRVQLGSTELVAGSSVDVTYFLANRTDQSVGGCAADWTGCLMWGTHAILGSVIVTNQTCAPENMFRVPPHATLNWTSTVEVLRVGLGAAKFIGQLRSIDGSWLGEVRSEPVEVTVVGVH